MGRASLPAFFAPPESPPRSQSTYSGMGFQPVITLYWSVCLMRLFVSLLVLAVLTVAEPAIFAGEPQAGSKQHLITMNFDNVDISVLAKFISRVTGKNFVLDQGVRGQVSIIAPTKVTPAQAYCIFEAALQLKGFATVAAGPVIKIMPSRDARAWASVTHSQTPAGQCAQPIAPNGTQSTVPSG